MSQAQMAALLIGAGALAMLLTWLATGIVRSHAVRHSMLDVPNQRSSHSSPTPRGGGAAIVAVVLLSVAVTGITGLLDLHVTVAILGGGALIGAVGWMDDRHNVSPAWRAVAHLSAAIWATYWLGGLGQVHLGSLGVLPGRLGDALAILTIAWMTNLYNFMDGIDGLAAVETISVGVAGSVVLLISGALGLAVVTACLAGASAGFLIWNRMPARIFMGDVGSGFIGFILGAIGVASHKTAAVNPAIWGLLLLAFVADATTTLLRRIGHGERWHAAHRLHAYQRLVQSGLSHAQVVTCVSVLNAILAACAVAVLLHPTFAWPVSLGAVIMIAIAYAAVERRLGMWKATR